MKNIIFIAPPAAGKGTQSELLVKEFAYKHISTGDLLREKQNDGSLLGNIIKDEKLSDLTRKIEECLSSSEYEVYALMISGLKYGEIALLLNKNPKQVDNTIQRVKHKIKNIIEKK